MKEGLFLENLISDIEQEENGRFSASSPIRTKSIVIGLIISLIMTAAFSESLLAQSKKTYEYRVLTSDESNQRRRIWDLISQLSDQDKRKSAQQELLRIGNPAMEHLLAGLRNKDKEIQKYCAQTINMMEENAKYIKETLLGSFNYDEDKISLDNYGVLRQLIQILTPEDTYAIKPLMKLFRADPKMYTHDQILRILEMFGPAAAETVPDISAALREKIEKNHANTDQYAKTLGAFGPAAEEGIPVLLELLNSRAGNVVGTKSIIAGAIVRIGLGKSGLSLDEVVGLILKAFGSSRYLYDSDRQYATESLLLLGEDGRKAIIKFSSKSSRQEELLMATKALDAINARSGDAIAALIKTSRDKNNAFLVRISAIKELGEGEPNRKILNALQKLKTYDKDLRVRIFSHKAILNLQKGHEPLLGDYLKDFSEDEIISKLIQSMAYGKKFITEIVKEASEEIGERSLPELVRALGTKPPFDIYRKRPSEIAMGAQQILKSFGDKAAPVLIEAMYATDNDNFFNRAAQLLLDMSYEPQTEKEKIVYYFIAETSRKHGHRYDSDENFKQLSQVGPAAVPFLIRMLKMEGIGSYGSVYALEALGALGQDAVGILPELQEMYNLGKFPSYELDIYFSAVARIGGEEAFRILKAALGNDHLDGQTKIGIILMGLNKVGASDWKILDLLKAMIKDDDYQIRISVYVVLASKRYFDSPGIHQIVLKGLDDSHDLVRFNVINFLGSKGPKASFALPRLKQIIEDPNTEEDLGGFNLREAAKQAYRNIQDPYEGKEDSAS